MNRKLLAAIALAAAVGLAAFLAWASIVEPLGVGMVFAVGLVAGVSLKTLFESSTASGPAPAPVRMWENPSGPQRCPAPFPFLEER